MYLAALAAEGDRRPALARAESREYSHLVHIGALDLDDALRLVDERGRCYDEAPPGIMATVLAVDHDSVASVVERALIHGPIAISNINAPTQHVIAGAEPAVTWAAATLEEETLRAHRDHRAPRADALAADGAGREGVRPGPAARAVASAVTDLLSERRRRADCESDRGDFVSHLTRHVSEPVLWQRSVDRLVVAAPRRRSSKSAPAASFTT